MKIDWLIVCHYENSLKESDLVIGRFTNCGKKHQFKGEFVGSTKNYHKVKVLENFRGDNEVGRILHIQTSISKLWSANNTILNPEWIKNE